MNVPRFPEALVENVDVPMVKEVAMINRGARGRLGLKLRTFFVTLLLFFVSSAPVVAQEAGGTIVGTVTDPTGAAVRSANVTIKNAATGVERNPTPNADGVYAAPNLTHAAYAITATPR